MTTTPDAQIQPTAQASDREVLIEVRNLLLEHLQLTEEEALHLTRSVIQYWAPSRPTIDYDGDQLEGPDIGLD